MANSITIAKGATLSGLAKQYNTSVDEILKANPNIKNPDVITVGQSLILPETQKVSPYGSPAPTPYAPYGKETIASAPTVSGGSYIIKSGDTLSGIARAQGTTVSELMKLNPSITNPNLIIAGKALNLPGSTIAPVSGSQQDYSSVQNVNEANALINQNQESDVASGEKDDEPPVRSSLTDLTEALKVATKQKPADKTDISQIAEAIKPGTAKPDVISLESKFGDLKTTYGVETLENELNDLNAQAADIQATIRARKAAEGAKTVAMNVIEGRVGEVERQEMERLDAVQRQIDYKTNQLNTKYKIIDTYMKLADMDYDNAVKAYDDELSANISMFNVLKGVQESEKSEQERITDNARASVQIIYNQLSSGGVKIDDMTSDQQTLITKLETQAGLPIGFFKTLQNKNPKAEIVSTTNWTDENNNEYVSVISKDSTTGALSTQNVLLGKAKITSGSASESDLKTYYKQNISAELDKVVGGDGYVSPDDWAKARKSWTANTPYTADDFVANFIDYVNPENEDDYVGVMKYKY